MDDNKYILQPHDRLVILSGPRSEVALRTGLTFDRPWCADASLLSLMDNAVHPSFAGRIYLVVRNTV